MASGYRVIYSIHLQRRRGGDHIPTFVSGKLGVLILQEWEQGGGGALLIFSHIYLSNSKPNYACSQAQTIILPITSIKVKLDINNLFKIYMSRARIKLIKVKPMVKWTKPWKLMHSFHSFLDLLCLSFSSSCLFDSPTSLFIVKCDSCDINSFSFM